MNGAILLTLIIAGLSSVQPHGYVRRPLARTSIFRDPSFGANMPFWWNDTGVMCGDEVQDANFSRCGRCGDAFGQTHANQGGTYDKGIITGTYTAGQVSSNEVVAFADIHDILFNSFRSSMSKSILLLTTVVSCNSSFAHNNKRPMVVSHTV